MNNIEKIDLAIKMCQKLDKEYPGFVILDSIDTQLRYVKNIIEKNSTDKSKLKDILLGVYAAKEIEERDMNFAELLYEIQDIAEDLNSTK